MAVARTRRRPRRSARRAQYRPFTARLSASVPPLVKITSLGRAPNTSAICSLDSSTTRRARLPAACSEDGFPSRVSSSVIAAIASGRIGVVAAWSRYTGLALSGVMTAYRLAPAGDSELLAPADLLQKLGDHLE